MAKYKIIPSSRTIMHSPISIGHKAEKGVEAIEFDLTAWVETYGSGTLTVIMRRWGDAIPYPIALEIDENNKATWTLSDIDTAKAGMAYAQLNYIVGETVVKKSDIYTFRVMDSLTGEGEPPEAYDSWLEHLTHLAAEAMAEVLDIEGIVTDKTLTVDGGIADAKAAGDALALKADKSTTYTKTQVDQMIADIEVETDTTLSVSGKPADAAETGRQIGSLKADLGATNNDLRKMVGNIPSTWSLGGMYVGTGIEYPSSSAIRTPFIAVQPGDTIYFDNPDTSLTVTVFEFANNTPTSAGVNERLAVTGVTNLSKKITLGGTTNYIRLQMATGDTLKGDDVLAYTKNNIAFDSIAKVSEDLNGRLDAREDDLYDMIGMFEFSWESGGMSTNEGINYSSNSNIRTNFKPVSNAKSIIVKNTSGTTAAVYEFAGNQTTESGTNERLSVTYISPNTSKTITLNANTAYIRCQIQSGTLSDSNYLLVYTFNSIIANEFKSVFKRGYKADYGLDLNNYTDSGYYGLNGSEYQNAPARDGVLIVYNYYNTIYISQMVLTFSNVKKSRCYIRSGRADSNPSWTDWVELLPKDNHVISNNKIAIFGDSIMSGTVKTPTSNQTHVVGLYIQQQLKTKVVDGAIGSIGYISRGPLSYNILELVKSVDLSGCKFFVCSAGDNDYQYPLGVYTDTNADYSDYATTDSGATVMGNIYKLCKYLHETYNDMTIVLCNKPNATTSGTFPTYRRTIGTRVQQLNAEIKNFCEYYGCGFIDFDKIGFDGWMLPQVLGNDGVHLTTDGYKKLSVFISGELLKFTGTGDCFDSTTDIVKYPS